jgi:hypothetical protein
LNATGDTADMLAIALALTLTSATPARAIIWGGGTSPEAQAAELNAWQQVAAAAKDLLVLPAGYPKLVRSEAVPGLKPGFHLVLLGLCAEADAQTPFFVLKGVRESVYSRAVTVEALACPALRPEWKPDELEPVKAAAGALKALRVTKSDAEWRFFVGLVDAKGELLDFASETSVGCVIESSLDDERADATAVTAKTTCVVPACTTPDETRQWLSWSVSGKRIVRRVTKREFSKGECD